MSADKDGNEDLFENILLSDDDLAHLLEDSFAHGVELFYALLEQCCVLI